jgi:four helix bundle protein
MSFHEDLKIKMHLFVKYIYRVTKSFPRDELYGVTSQLRRAALSVILNYTEGFVRRRGKNIKVYENFLETSYGSLKEAKYLVYFSYTENYLNEIDYNNLMKMADDIGGMLWGVLENLTKDYDS